MTDTVQFRSDFRRAAKANHETRTPERLAAHYALESRLADRLRFSSAGERGQLYARVYDELFSSLPDHPQHVASSDIRTQRLVRQSRLLLARLQRQSTYLEIGCGDAALTKLIAPNVREAIGVDVTGALIDPGANPGNSSPGKFRFLLTDGTRIRLPDDAVDLVYSNQLMEHLHPDDVDAQLAEIVRVLKPGGQYVCTTPNRLTGPHDISRYFRYEPNGFHLREYDHASLDRLFRRAGFRSVRPLVTVKGASFTLPLAVATVCETAMRGLPRRVRAIVAANRLVSSLAGVTVVGVTAED